MFASAQTERRAGCSNDIVRRPQETDMFIGGSILGTILVIALIVYLVRRV
jgi:hypothetical protein